MCLGGMGKGMKDLEKGEWKIGKGIRREMKRSGKDEMRKGRHLERTRVHELIRTKCKRFLSMLYSNQRLGTRGNKCKDGN